MPLGTGSAFRYLAARRRVSAAVKEFRPAVVHVHFGYSGLAAPRLTVPLVTTFYGDDLNGTWHASGGITLRSRIGVAASHWVAWRSVRCVTVSETLRRRLLTAGLRRKTSVIRDAVDFRLFRPLPQGEARSRLGLAMNDIIVLFPHDATQATKRIWLAEAAVRELQQRLPRCTLRVVNGRPADEMPWQYAAADVMLVTSALEGGPSSVKEALACGVPVVSVSVGDLEMFDDAPDGMLRSQSDPATLADVLERALTGPRTERRPLLPERFDLAKASMALVAVYEEALRVYRGAHA